MEVKYTAAMGILKLSLIFFLPVFLVDGGGGGMRVGWKVNFLFFFSVAYFLKVNTIYLIYGQGACGSMCVCV